MFLKTIEKLLKILTFYSRLNCSNARFVLVRLSTSRTSGGMQHSTWTLLSLFLPFSAHESAQFSSCPEISRFIQCLESFLLHLKRLKLLLIIFESFFLSRTITSLCALLHDQILKLIMQGITSEGIVFIITFHRNWKSKFHYLIYLFSLLMDGNFINWSEFEPGSTLPASQRNPTPQQFGQDASKPYG